MKIRIEQFQAVISEAKLLRETIDIYCLAPDKVPVSLDDVTQGIQQRYGVAVMTKLVPLKSELLRGMIETYTNKTAIIYIDAELSLSLTKYVFVKETCHIMLANAESCTIDPTAIIEYFVQDGLPTADESQPGDDIMSEELAKIGAVEILFPYKLREPSKKRIAEGKDTVFTIAEWLEIPEHLVEYALSDRYMKLADAIWNKTSAAPA